MKIEFFKSHKKPFKLETHKYPDNGFSVREIGRDRIAAPSSMRRKTKFATQGKIQQETLSEPEPRGTVMSATFDRRRLAPLRPLEFSIGNTTCEAFPADDSKESQANSFPSLLE